jgi:hypothetical protein
MILLLSATVMFALATADIALSFRLILRDIPSILRQEIQVADILEHVYPKNPLFVTNKFVSSFSPVCSGS